METCQQADSHAVFLNAQHGDAAEGAQQLLNVPAPSHSVAILARFPLPSGLRIILARSPCLVQLRMQQLHARASGNDSGCRALPPYLRSAYHKDVQQAI